VSLNDWKAIVALHMVLAILLTFRGVNGSEFQEHVRSFKWRQNTYADIDFYGLSLPPHPQSTYVNAPTLQID
jgi:hypothetical protein